MKRRKPRQVEHLSQCSVIAQCRLMERKYPELKYLHSSQGGARVRPSVANNLKKAGMRAGVPDLFLPLPIPRGPHGLYIEMKAPGGVVSEIQRDFMRFLDYVGYRVRVCYSAQAAIDEIIAYMKRYKAEKRARQDIPKNSVFMGPQAD